MGGGANETGKGKNALLTVQGSPGSEVWLKEDDQGRVRLGAAARGITSCASLLRGFQKKQLRRVTFVDASFNSLQTIEGLETLPRLETLDIRCNCVPSMQALLPTLRKCASLRHLRLRACGKFAKDPRSYHQELCRELPALLSIDEIRNPNKLNEQQWRAQRFLSRVFGIGPNGIADIDLNGREICGEDFACVLRALSHLPVLRLRMKENPAAEIRGYRCYVIKMLKSLRELDGQPLTSDERVNANREVKGMCKEVASVKLEMARVKSIQTLMNTPRSCPGQFASLSSLQSEYNHCMDDSSSQSASKSYKIEEISRSSSASDVGTSPFAPKRLNFKDASRGGSSSSVSTPGKGKINLMLVASKPLREDIVEFLEKDDTALVKNLDMPQMLKCLENAPMQAIAGRIWSKLEVLLNFLQIYRLIFVSNVPWPPMWDTLNNEADVTTFLLHYVPSLVFGGNHKSTQTSMVIFFVFLFLPVLLLAIYHAKIIDAIIPDSVDYFLVKLTGYSWKMIRKRTALFGLTVSFLPLANTMLSALMPERQGDAVVVKGFPSVPYPITESDFDISVHWFMIIAAAASILYIPGIPATCAYLILKGAKEAGRAHAVEKAKQQIAEMKQAAMGEQFVGYGREIAAHIAERERACDLLYAKAVREYHKAQTYLYEDYTENAKLYKVQVMVWKILLLANVLGTGSAVLTASATFAIMQTTLSLLLAGGMLVLCCLQRPFQASSENLLEVGLIATNVLNAIIAFLLAVVLHANGKQAPSITGTNVTGGILLINNALALSFAFGVILATPLLNKLARREIKRLKDWNVHHAVQQAVELQSVDVVSPSGGSSKSASRTSSRIFLSPRTAFRQELVCSDLRRTIGQIAAVSGRVPPPPPGAHAARSESSQGSSPGPGKVSSSRDRKEEVKKNKSIILQLFDEEYGSPFCKRLQTLRYSDPDPAPSDASDDDLVSPLTVEDA